MKKSILLTTAAAVLFSATPSYASWRHVDGTKCYTTREEYVPGRFREDGMWMRGYVVLDKYEVPCRKTTSTYGTTIYRQHDHHTHTKSSNTNNKCDSSKTTLGAIGGGGIGAALSRGNGRWWAIPLGAFIGGSSYGCN